MTKITTGILGGGSGSIGNLTLQVNKGINIIRSKPIPKDPKSPAQLLQRSYFTLAATLTKNSFPTIIQPCWLQYPPKQTNRSFFMQKALHYFKLNGQLGATFRFIQGKEFLPYTGQVVEQDLEGNWQVQFYDPMWDNKENTYYSFAMFNMDTLDVYRDPNFYVGHAEEYFPVNLPKNIIYDDFLFGVIVQDRTELPYSFYTTELIYLGT